MRNGVLWKQIQETLFYDCNWLLGLELYRHLELLEIELSS